VPATPTRAAAAVRWGVVVPVKRLELAKSRLGAYGDELRRQLALAFAADVVVAASGCRGVQRLLVVTDDPTARELLSSLGAEVAADLPDAGLNAALVHGAACLRDRDASLSLVALSADLPALRPEDLQAALEQVPAGGRAFVPDAVGTGTTLLAARAPSALHPAYGAGSRARHRESGALELVGSPALRRDVDTPSDLRDAVGLGVGSRTAEVVSRLPASPFTS
jgi:2-phospho-L-lactate guanylyltransferase